jgi:hypothetical protein
MRRIESNTFVDDFDPLTPTLSRREREKTMRVPEGERLGYPKRQIGFVRLLSAVSFITLLLICLG